MYAKLHCVFDTALDEPVVVTPCLTDYLATKDRFYRHAAMEMGLQHPNILAVRDIVEQNGIPYTLWSTLMARALIASWNSDDLSRSLRGLATLSRLPRAELCTRKRIVHRNIKSSNVLILKDGSVKIFDFSMAYFLDEHSRALSPHDRVMGTPTHMSPEQIRGHVVDARSDIFSTGIILYSFAYRFAPFPRQQFGCDLNEDS